MRGLACSEKPSHRPVVIYFRIIPYGSTVVQPGINPWGQIQTAVLHDESSHLRPGWLTHSGHSCRYNAPTPAFAIYGGMIPGRISNSPIPYSHRTSRPFQSLGNFPTYGGLLGRPSHSVPSASCRRYSIPDASKLTFSTVPTHVIVKAKPYLASVLKSDASAVRPMTGRYIAGRELTDNTHLPFLGILGGGKLQHHVTATYSRKGADGKVH